MDQLTRILFVLAAASTCLVTPSAFASVATVTSHQFVDSIDYERALTLQWENQKLRFLLNPSSVTSTTLVTDSKGRPRPYANNAFSGVIEDDKNSWARLFLQRERLSGVFSKANRQYEIKTSVFGGISITPLTNRYSIPLTKRRPLALTRITPVTKIAEIGIVVDRKFDDFHGGNGVSKALAIINAVDGIYREKFGLALKLTKLVTVGESEQDPFDYGVIPIEEMLFKFRDYRMSSDALGDVSLVHLFTGNRNSDEPVGLAWINTACRNDGYDVGISTPYRYDVLLAAHEIAHNLGAQHDSDTSCSSQEDKVMWPYISFNTSQNFSNCTVDSVQQALRNSCHADTIDLQVSLSQPDTQTIEVTVRNNDLRRTNSSATLTVDLPENSAASATDSRCESPQTNIECNLGELHAGAEETLSIRLLSSPESDRTAGISVENDDFADPRPLNNQISMLVNNGEIIALMEPQLNAADGAVEYIKVYGGIGGIPPIDILIGMLGLVFIRKRRSSEFANSGNH